MSAKETLRRVYKRTSGPLTYIAAIAAIVGLLNWILSLLDVRIPKVNLEPQPLIIAILLVLAYVQSWLLLQYLRKNRVLKLKLDTRQQASESRGTIRPELALRGTEQKPQISRPSDSLLASNVTQRTEGRRLIDRTFVLHRDEIWDYRIKGRKGSALNVQLVSSSPIDVFLVDQWHYSRDDYDNAEEEESEVIEAKFRIDCPKDVYYLTIMNEGQRNAQVKVEAWLE